MDLRGMKARVLRADVVDGEDGAGLDNGIQQFLADHASDEVEVVGIIQVAEYAVLIVYTGG